MKACIATSKAPTDFEAFLDAIKALAMKQNVTIQGYVVTSGYNCANHGIMLIGDNTEKFLNQLTMALMPARWSIVSDDDPGVSEGQFELQITPIRGDDE